VVQGTIGKAFDVVGSCITADDVICGAIRGSGSGFIFTTALPPALAYGASASLQYLQSCSIECYRQKHQAEILTQKLHSANLPIIERTYILHQ